MKKNYDIAAYVWPAYTGDEPRTRMFWEEGIGEWQTVKNSVRKDNGYLWDRKPLWGYVNEADPYIMEAQIEAAYMHGVNIFIYDWYWFDGRPFLEQCLNNGYLKAKNNDKVKFYIMWANHDANYTWDIRNSDDNSNTVIWQGSVNEEQFKKIGKRWIENYFLHPSYYKINGKPVLSIYDLKNFIVGLSGVANARKNLDWLDNEAKKYGLSGVHIQLVKCWDSSTECLTGIDSDHSNINDEVVSALGCDSLTHYQYVHCTNIDRKYSEIMPDVKKVWNEMPKGEIPYFPHVSIGWDNNPRFRKFRHGITTDNTPEEFEKALIAAKEFSDKYCDVPLITINSWNEWTETSYLQPDNIYGYGYLEAIKRVFKD